MAKALKTEGDTMGKERALPDRASVLSMAADLRRSLRFHAAMGIASYPLLPARKGAPQQCEMVTPPQTKPGGAAPASVALSHSSGERVQPWNKQEAERELVMLQGDVEACRMCSLASARQGLILGQGAVGSSLLVVGDYCSQENGFSTATLFGADEDVMLWNMMRAIGLTPSDVYVTNAVKCCPLPAQSPGTESGGCCRAHLIREIRLIRPRIVCAMGELAARAVLGGEASISRSRGKLHRYGGSAGGDDPPQVVVTYHPRFLLKHAELKKPTWQDLQIVQRQLQMG